jgi:hypothetical protein
MALHPRQHTANLLHCRPNPNQPSFAKIVTLGETTLLHCAEDGAYLLEVYGVNQRTTLAESFRRFTDGMKDCLPLVTGEGFADWLDQLARRLERTA